MKIILDCNIWISFLIGHQTQLVRKMLTDTRFDIYVCDELKAEIYDVSHRKKIRKYVSRQDIDDLFDIIHLFCKHDVIQKTAVSHIRDPKDLYLLSFAESIGANYIVSGDADLTVLEHYQQTNIIRLADFKKLMMY